MRVLFVKESLQWPRSSGHDVHCFHMMQALGNTGVELSLLTAAPCQPPATEGLILHSQYVFDELPAGEMSFSLPRLQEKFCSYWGTERGRIAAIARLVEGQAFDAVVVVGLDVLPYLAMIPSRVNRIWYAADEWFLHHLSQAQLIKPSSWSEIKLGAIKGLYEYAFTSCTDRVWVVSDKDATAVRWIMPRSAVDVIANGVDAQHFAPAAVSIDHSQIDSQGLVFWGRLDFGPNLDALDWFCKHVWTGLRRRLPELQWTVYGFQAGPQVKQLAATHGFHLVPDLPDLRHEILRHQIVVLPFVSGAGIKNKFLEAASLARPIIASRRALNGVDLKGGEPCLVANRPEQWIEQIIRLINDAPLRHQLGQQARAWVTENYSWAQAASLARKALKSK